MIKHKNKAANKQRLAGFEQNQNMTFFEQVKQEANRFEYQRCELVKIIIEVSSHFFGTTESGKQIKQLTFSKRSRKES